MSRAEGVTSLLGLLGGATVFDLEQPRYFGAPAYSAHQPGFVYTLHRRHEAGLGASRTSASGFIFAAEHSGTHIDALSHQAWEMELYGGVSVDAKVQTPAGFTAGGIEEVAPIMRRGILIDVAASAGTARLPDGHLINDSELRRAVDAQGVEVRAGDVVLIRTGNGGSFGNPEEYERAPGIDRSAAQWLADQKVFAVGADNLALDVIGHEDPELGPLPAHTVLIVNSGVFIIENLFLEEAADQKAYEFVFVCLPLKMRGVTASPVRPIALIPSA